MEFNKKEDFYGSNLLTFMHQDSLELAISCKNKLLNGESIEATEYRLKLANGNLKQVEISCINTIFKEQPAIQMVVYDLTQKYESEREKRKLKLLLEEKDLYLHELEYRKSVQKQLVETQKFMRSLIENSIDIICANEVSDKIVEFNPAAEKAFGYKRSEVIGKSASFLFGSVEKNKNILESLNNTGYFVGEVINLRKNGEKFISYLSAAILKDEKGNIIGSMGISRDITEVKIYEKELKRTQERYSTLFNQTHLGILIINKQSTIIEANERFISMSGYTKKEVINFPTKKFIHPEEYNKKQKLFEKLFSQPDFSQHVFEQRIITKNNKIAFTRVTISALKDNDEKTGLFVKFIEDITDEKLIQEKIQVQASKLNAIFQSSSHLIWTINQEGILTSFNTNFAKYIYHNFKQTIVDPYKTNIKNLIHFHDGINVNEWENNYSKVFKGKQQRFEFCIIDQKGQNNWIEIFLHPIFNTERNVVEVSGIGNDITARKKVETQLKEQAAKMHAIIESSSHLIWTIDKNSKLTSFNHNYAKFVEKNYEVDCKIGLSLNTDKMV